MNKICLFRFIRIVPSSQPAPNYNQSTLTPVIGVPFLGHNPTQIQCPRCQRQVFTRVQYEIGTGTWLIALGIFVFGGVLGCFLIPFCIPMCQDAVHSCPSCGYIIGRRDLI
jgi:lipopolysaccharide-induced tumor necrosis factor-alpha factor